MGTINYFTSDYITLGVNCNNIESDDDFYFLQEDFDAIDDYIKENNFYYFNVRVRAGYYEGFSIDIEFNFGYCLDSWQDRREANKEITRIRKFLINCIYCYGLRACSPGWCTAYYNKKDTLKKLSQAIKEMRDTVNSSPTWAQVRRAEGV